MHAQAIPCSLLMKARRLLVLVAALPLALIFQQAVAQEEVAPKPSQGRLRVPPPHLPGTTGGAKSSCARNLSCLAHSCRVYALSRSGPVRMYPRRLIDLFRHGKVCGKDMFRCPDDKTPEKTADGVAISYESAFDTTKRRLPGSFPRQAIMIWDKTPCHNGKRQTVCFGGAIRVLDETQFKEARENLRKLIGEHGQEDALAEKTVAELVIDLQKDYRLRQAISYELQERGEAAVPPLLELLKTNDYRRAQSAIQILTKIGGKTVAEGVIGLLKDPVQRGPRFYIVGQVLRQLSPTVVPTLVEALADSNPRVRRAVADALGNSRSKDAIAPLANALRDEDNSVCRKAAEALGQLRMAEATKALLDGLASQDPALRAAAARGLGSTRSAEVVPPLVDALGDLETSVRLNAATALGMIGTDEAASALIKASRDPDAGFASVAVRALGTVRKDAALEAMNTAMNATSGSVRVAAVQGLAIFLRSSAYKGEERRRKMALSYLVPGLGHVEPDVVNAARSSLGWQRIRHVAKLRAAVTDALITNLGNQNTRLRDNVVSILAGFEDKDAATQLVPLLGDDNRDLCTNTGNVLARMPRKYSMPALVEGLASPTSAIRSGAAACLGRIGDTAAVSALEVALADAEIAVRLQARDALEALGAAVPPADVLRTPQLDVGALRRCGRRLEAFGQAIILHAAANKGRLPAEIVPLYNILAARKPGAGASVSTTKIRELGCPMAAAGSGYVYLLQGTTATLMDVKDAHTLPVMHDAPPAHHGIYNVLFLDGHVEAVTAKQLNKLLEAPEEAILGKDTLKMVPLKAFAPIAPTHVETSTAAIAALAEALDDESSPIRGAAVRSLASIGADAVPVLIKALQHSKVRVRGNAAIALALIGPDAKAAVPALIRLLQDKDWKIQIQAIKTLDAIGPQAKAAVPALVKLAGGQDVALMTEATETLARMGPEGVRALQRLAADPPVAADSRLAALVHYTLESTGNSRIGQGIVRSPDEITSNTEVAIPELIAALKDQDSTVRSKAIGALRQMGTPAKRALLQALESGDPALRRGAVEAWSSFPSSAKERLSIFVEKLQDTDATVRWKAAEGIYKLGAAARPAIADLVRALTDEHPGVQGFASLTLAKTGDAGIQALAEALESDDQRLRWAAAKGFCWAFPRTKGVLAILKERDVDTDPVYACVTGKVGPRTTKALVEALQGDDLVIRQAVVVIIARHLGPKAKAAEPALIKMVTDPDAWLRYQAVSALSHIGPDAVEAVPVLIKALDDKGDCVALAAALALGNIGPAARNAIPALKKAHANGERELRFLATKAIRKIAAPPGK